MTSAKKLNKKLISFELEALSLLLHYWAEPSAVKKRTANWPDKLPRFRSAVIAGMGRGTHEKRTPRELVDSEYKEIYQALKWLRTECEEYEFDELTAQIVRIHIPCEMLGERGLSFRPIPLMAKDVRKICRHLLERDKKLSEIAYEVVGKRLRCSAKKVKEAAAKKSFKRFQISKSQRLLISVFLDLCSLPEKELRFDLLARILNTLFLNKCHLLIIYYLLQTAHTIETKLFFGDYNFDDVEVLCESICPKIKKFEFSPFTRLTSNE